MHLQLDERSTMAGISLLNLSSISQRKTSTISYPDICCLRVSHDITDIDCCITEGVSSLDYRVCVPIFDEDMHHGQSRLCNFIAKIMAIYRASYCMLILEVLCHTRVLKSTGRTPSVFTLASNTLFKLR